VGRVPDLGKNAVEAVRRILALLTAGNLTFRAAPVLREIAFVALWAHKLLPIVSVSFMNEGIAVFDELLATVLQIGWEPSIFT
jgi:hypothetical protein